MSAGAEQPIADAEARAQALDPANSFVVQAPAGSGKTELLVRRFLIMLTTVSRPEEVLAVTFTRKAAGEMRERVIGELRRAVDQAPVKSNHELEGREIANRVLERSEELAWNLVENPSRLRISTIDSLAGSIVGATPLLSRSGGATQVTEDSRPLLAEAVRRTLTSSDAGLQAAVAYLAERTQLRLGPLSTRLEDMLDGREQWISGIAKSLGDRDAVMARIEAAFEEVIEEQLQEARRVVGGEFMAELESLAVLSRSNLEVDACAWPTLGESSRLDDPGCGAGAWRELAPLAMTKSGTMRKRFDKNDGTPPGSPAKKLAAGLIEEWKAMEEEARAELESTITAAAALPVDGHFSEAGREALEAFFLLLLDAYRQLQGVFNERGQTDYAEVSLRAIAGLGRSADPTELLLLLDRTIQHILVDEFQDTNFLQCRLVGLLTSGWSENDGRTLFLVGDPMQSIYRFRRAEVGLFIEARAGRAGFEQLAIKPLSLSVSFRSTRSILGWVNDVFGPLMGDQEDGRRGVVAYADFAAAPKAEQGPDVELYRWKGAPTEALEDDAAGDVDESAIAREPAAASEARGLAKLIQQALAENAQQDEIRDIAVLLRSGKQGRALMEALADLQIPYNAAGVEGLGDRAVIRDLDALVRTLLHPADRLSAASLLRSPMIGLSVSDLNVLLEQGDDRDESGRRRRPALVGATFRDADLVSRLSPEGQLRVARSHTVLQSARAQLGRQPTSAIARGAWVELGGALVVAAAGGDGLGDVDRYLAAVDAADRGGLTDLDALARSVERLKSSSSPGKDVRVVFLTMHAAKGLEFDTVILPRLGGKGGRDDLAALALETDPRTLDLRLVAPRPLPRGENPDLGKYELIVARERTRARSELLRLFYVAATRAKRRLILSTAVKPIKRGFEKPRSGSLLSEAWSVLEGSFSSIEPQVAAALETSATACAHQLRSSFAWTGTPPSVEVHALKRRTASGGPEASSSDDAWDEETGPVGRFHGGGNERAVGRVTHAILERIVLDGVDAWPVSRLQSDVGQLRRRLRQENVAAMHLDDCVAAVQDAIVGTLEDAEGHSLLTETEQSYAEWPLVYRAGQDFVTAIIDRSFVRDGERWIVDYKTATPPQGGSLEDWVSGQLEKYASQLNTYAEVVAAAQGAFPELTAELPIRTALYFTALPAGHRLQVLS